jgi:hypothetical protein
LPSGADLAGQISEDVIRAASAEEIQSLLALGKECLQSPKPLVLGAGLYLFLNVSLRFDSSKFIESYVDDLALLLEGQDRGGRKMAIFILGNTNPSPPPSALAHEDPEVSQRSRQVLFP